MADSNIVVSGLTVSPGIGALILDWAAVDASDFKNLPYMQLDKFEVWAAATNNRANATKVGETPANQYTIKGLSASVTRYCWVRARDLSGNLGDFFPLSATAGISGTTSTVLPPDNSITNDMLQANSVGESNLQINSVSASKLQADSVVASKINVSSLEAISATLGNVVVNGSLIVNGTLITGKAASEAWTIIRGGSAGNAVACAFGVVKIVASCIQPSQGKPVMVVGSCAVDGTSGTSAPYIEIGLWRNSLKLVAYRLRADNANRFRPAALVFADLAPPAGNVTYSLTQEGIDTDSAVGQTSGHAIATFQGLR